MIIEGHSFHLAHIQHGKEVLLLALPATTLSQQLVQATLTRIEATLSLLFGSTHKYIHHILLAIHVLYTCCCLFVCLFSLTEHWVVQTITLMLITLSLFCFIVTHLTTHTITTHSLYHHSQTSLLYTGTH